MSFASLLAQDLASLERHLASSWDEEPALASGPMRALVGAGGKRIRPTLLLVCARAGEYDFGRLLPAAAAVELIHSSTLVHDDVIDRSAVRRGLPTVYATAGVASGILIGDFYFSRAYREAARTGDARVVEMLAQAVMDMCDGELEQLRSRYVYRLDLPLYIRRCELKTGRLMAASCLIGARLAGLSESEQLACANFGMQIGVAFQIVDDVLDYEAEEAVLGKPAGHDLMEGNATLPLMLALESGALDATLAEGHPVDPGRVAEVVATVRRSGACEAAMRVARAHHEEARSSLSRLPSEAARRMLSELAGSLLERRS